MTPTITAIVATFGDDEWKETAKRAVGSLVAQSVPPLEIIQVHDKTLATARNRGASEARGEWLFFLDADDMADQHYIDAMTQAAEGWQSEFVRTPLFQPATSALYDDGTTDGSPNVIPPRGRLLRLHGNHMVIGTVVKRQMFLAAGGFFEESSMEDWSLWLRCYALGAQCVPVPGAVYLVQQGRGRNLNHSKSIFTDVLRSFDRWCKERGLDANV